MWIFFAFGSAFFAGITAILAKCGIRDTDSNVATAIRTSIVFICSWLMVFISHSQETFSKITPRTLVFLMLSGIATGASWLCYFRALQLGDVNKVTPIDKSSTIVTMLLAFVCLGEPLSFIKIVSMFSIGAGTLFMIQKKREKRAEKEKGVWLLYACGSALFASLTSILGKVGISGIDSTLGTAIRTIVVLIMAWLMVFLTKKQGTIKNIDKNSWVFLILSGIATGASWLCYYRALQTGPASVVVPIDKLSIILTIAFSYFILKEKLNRRALLGLFLITAGTLSLLA